MYRDGHDMPAAIVLCMIAGSLHRGQCPALELRAVHHERPIAFEKLNATVCGYNCFESSLLLISMFTLSEYRRIVGKKSCFEHMAIYFSALRQPSCLHIHPNATFLPLKTVAHIERLACIGSILRSVDLAIRIYDRRGSIARTFVDLECILRGWLQTTRKIIG